MKIRTQKTRYSPKSLSDFVTQLRRFKRDSIVDISRLTLWQLYRQKSPSDDAIFLIQAYAPKIILLALATTNNYREKEFKSPADLHDFCSQYMHIPGPISDPRFLDEEAANLTQKLLEKSARKGTIPQKYISVSAVRECAGSLFVQRTTSEQNHHRRTRFAEVLNDYHILKILDKKHDNIASEYLERHFGCSILTLYRTLFCLFALGLDADINGKFDLNLTPVEEAIEKTLEIGPDTLRRIAKKISFKETDLFDGWFKGNVLAVNSLYQRYVPTPLITSPLVHLQKESPNGNLFLIPSPELYIRGIRHAVFSKIRGENKSIGNWLGKAIEKHFGECLRWFFGEREVSRINQDGKHADFIVELKSINLIFEIKTNVGSIKNRSILSPEDTAVVWERLYSAVTQCSNSLKKVRDTNKKTICVVLVADYVTVEHISFYDFCNRTNILSDLEIDALEFMPWNRLEHILWNSTPALFEENIAAKWVTSPPKTLNDALALSFDRSNETRYPSYIDEIENELFRDIGIPIKES